jgi:hypothetical protein
MGLMPEKHDRMWNMSHLPSERLAALLDERPTAEELAHLSACPDCAREPAAYALLAGLAKADPGPVLPLTRWASLAPALEREQLIDTRRSRMSPSGARSRAWLQVAAGVALAAGGMAAGRYSAGASPVSFHLGAQVAARDTGILDKEPQFQTVAEAVEAQSRSQAEYQSAVTFLAQHNSSGRAGDSPASMSARLAALAQVRATMDQALRDAPSDPVINGFYLSALGQQAAARRQLTSPIRLTSY